MPKKLKILSICCLFLISFLFTTITFAQFTEIQQPALNADPGTINFTQIDTTGENVTIPWIAQYILGWYKYAIIIGASLAVLFIILAGLSYLTSFGDPGKVKKAKQRVIGAIIGLVVLLGAYLILNLINPTLTELKGINLLNITKEEITYVDGWGQVTDSQLKEVGNLQESSCGKQITNDYFKKSADISVPNELQLLATKKTAYFSDTTLINFYNKLSTTEKSFLCEHIYSPNKTCNNPDNNGLSSAWLSDLNLNSSFLTVNGSLQGNERKLQAFTILQLKNVAQDAEKAGIYLTATSLYREPTTQIKTWNSGLISRYKLYKDNIPDNNEPEKMEANFKKAKTANGKMISKPNCTSPHVTGGAIDLKITKIINPETKEEFNDSPSFNGYNSASQMENGIYNNKFKALLNHLMTKNGFIRYCGEWWHFEYGTSKEKNVKHLFPGSTCGVGSGATTWEKTKIEIPQKTLNEIKKMIGETGMKALGL